MLLFVIGLLTLIIWSAVYVFVLRPAMKLNPAFARYFEIVGPYEQAIWSRSKTIFVGRAYWLSGVLLAIHEVVAYAVPDWTPVFGWLLSRASIIPEELRPLALGLAVSLSSALTGLLINKLRKITDTPVPTADVPTDEV